MVGRRAALAKLPIAAGITLVVGYHFASAQQTLDAYKFGRDAQQGKKIAPVPLNLQGKNPELVYLGRYLVNGQGDAIAVIPARPIREPIRTRREGME